MLKKWFFIAAAITCSCQAQASELELNINLAKHSGEYHNPYVAAWLEDDSGKTVRTLVLWREGGKWLKDLRTWWRKVGRRNKQVVDAVTSATRPAGNYQLTFKLEDDHGQALPQGTYRLKLEVVREHGGRGISQQAFTINGETQSYTLSATAETMPSSFSIKE